MLKKIVSIVLSLAMLLSVISVSAATDTITDEKGRVIYTDDFEHLDEGKSINSGSSTLYESAVIVPVNSGTEDIDTSLSRPKGTAKTVVGVDGSNTIAYVSPGASGKKYAKTIELDFGKDATGTKEYEFSFDFKVNKILTAGTLYILNRGYKDGVWNLFSLTTNGNIQTKTESGMAYSADTWYHVSAVLNGSTIKAWITDAAGNSCYSTLSDVQQKSVGLFYMQNTPTDFSLIMDNIKIVEYEPSVVAPEVKSAPVESGTENVQRNLALSFEFDQVVTIDDTMDVSPLVKVNPDGSTEEVTGAVISVIENSRKVAVSYEGLLERNTTYRVSLTNVINGNELPCEMTYEFATEDLHLWEPVTDMVIGSTDGETGLTPITFTIADEYDYSKFDGAALVVVHKDGVMVSCDMVALDNADAGSCTEDFALGTIPAGADISIVLLNCDNGPIPLASGTTAQ